MKKQWKEDAVYVTKNKIASASCEQKCKADVESFAGYNGATHKDFSYNSGGPYWLRTPFYIHIIDPETTKPKYYGNNASRCSAFGTLDAHSVVFSQANAIAPAFCI